MNASRHWHCIHIGIEFYVTMSYQIIVTEPVNSLTIFVKLALNELHNIHICKM